MSGKLTPKQEKFCQKFIELGNASEAYRTVYNVRTATEKTVWESASKLLADPKVAARVQELQAIHQKRHEKLVDRVLKELERLAFVDIRKAFDKDGHLLPIHELDDDTAAAIAGIDIETRKLGELMETRTTKFKLSDKRGSLETLAKHLGIAGKDDDKPPVSLNFSINIGDAGSDKA